MIFPRASRRPRGPRAARAQARLQLPFQLPARVDVERLVYRLVADPHGRVVRVVHLEPPAGLLGRVPAVQHALDRRPQPGIAGQLRGLRAALPAPGQAVGPLGLVAARAGVGVAAQFPADGGRGPAGPGRDLPHRQAGLAEPGDLVPLLAGQVTVTAGRFGRLRHPAHPRGRTVRRAHRHAGQRRRPAQRHPRRDQAQQRPVPPGGPGGRRCRPRGNRLPPRRPPGRPARPPVPRIGPRHRHARDPRRTARRHPRRHQLQENPLPPRIHPAPCHQHQPLTDQVLRRPSENAIE